MAEKLFFTGLVLLFVSWLLIYLTDLDAFPDWIAFLIVCVIFTGFVDVVISALVLIWM